MTSAFLLLGGGALLGNRFRTCLIENERLGVNGVSGVGNAGAFTALCTRCVGIARRVVVSASVCSRERTRRGHRACPYASRESITPFRRAAARVSRLEKTSTTRAARRDTVLTLTEAVLEAAGQGLEVPHATGARGATTDGLDGPVVCGKKNARSGRSVAAWR